MTADDVDRSIREGLRAARARAGMSQSSLARRTGLKPAAISHFEIGTRTPNAYNLARLCVALDVSADTLLGIDKRKP